MLLKGHYQNAYVTADIEQALTDLRQLENVENVLQFEAPLELWTPHGAGLAVMKIALIWVGKLQYEFIEPVSGLVDIYRDAVPASGVRFHHIGMRVRDWDALLAEIERQQLPIVLKGEMPGVKFLYVDARKTLGHYLEYVLMPDEAWQGLGGR